MTGDFGWALEQMREGKRVQRPSWDRAEWIAIKDGVIADEDGFPTVFRDSKPLLATDWRLAP